MAVSKLEMELEHKARKKVRARRKKEGETSATASPATGSAKTATAATSTKPVVDADKPEPGDASATKRKREEITLANLLLKKPEDIALIDARDVARITVKQFKDAGASDAQVKAFRGAKDPTAVDSKRRETDLTETRLSALEKAKRSIKFVGAWDKHWSGTRSADEKLQMFIEDGGWTPESLVNYVLDSHELKDSCTFSTSTHGDRICEVQINLEKIFGDHDVKSMYIGAGVTKTSVEVFHIGPGR